MMRYNSFIVKLFIIMEQKRTIQYLSKRWWHITMLGTCLLEEMPFHWFRHCGRVPTNIIHEDYVDGVVNYNTSGMLYPISIFYLRICWNTWSMALITCCPDNFQTEWQNAASLQKMYNQNLAHFFFQTLNCSLVLALLLCIESTDCDKPDKGCCWTCAKFQFMWPWGQALIGGAAF